MYEVTYMKRCPNCRRINTVSKTRARHTKLSMENLYECICGKKYIEYRFFENVDKNGNVTHACKALVIKIKSNKTDRIINAYKMRNGSVAVIKQGKLKVVDKNRFTVV